MVGQAVGASRQGAESCSKCQRTTCSCRAVVAVAAIDAVIVIKSRGGVVVNADVIIIQLVVKYISTKPGGGRKRKKKGEYSIAEVDVICQRRQSCRSKHANAYNSCSNIPFRTEKEGDKGAEPCRHAKRGDTVVVVVVVVIRSVVAASSVIVSVIIFTAGRCRH